MARFTRKGSEWSTNGELPAVGSMAPDFVLVDADLKDVSLADFAGRKKLLNIVPSLDTPTCAKSTRRFNEFAAGRDDVAVLVVSADLPFAQSRFCSAENTTAVRTLSMMRSRRFAKDYGVLVQDGPIAGITARAVVVLDAGNKVIYTQFVPDTGQEPDYEAAIAALGR